MKLILTRKAPLLAGLLLCALVVGDAAGNKKTSVLPNGTSMAWTYDARNRLTKVEHRLTSTNALINSYDGVRGLCGER